MIKLFLLCFASFSMPRSVFNHFFVSLPILLSVSNSAWANDGYKLWLQYYPLKFPYQEVKSLFSNCYLAEEGPTIEVIKKELSLAHQGFKLHKMISSFPFIFANLILKFSNSQI